MSRTATFWSVNERGPSEQGLANGKGHEQGRHSGSEMGWGQKLNIGRVRLEEETTKYLWDGSRLLAEYTGEGAPLAEYYSAGDRILARKMFGLHGRKEPGAPTMNTTGGLLYYSYDGLGNVSALTDRLGQVAARYRYDAFGGLLTSATAPYNLIGAFGKEFDPASGLIYFGARWYDAQTGRFTTPDPYQGNIQDPVSMHGYLYAKASPPNYIDRWGYTHSRTWVYKGIPIVTEYLVHVLEYRLLDEDDWGGHHWHYYEYRLTKARRDLPDEEWEVLYDHFTWRDWVIEDGGGSGGGGGTSPPQPTPEEIAAGKFDEAVQLGGLSPYETTLYTHATSPYPPQLGLSDDLAPRLRTGDWNPQRNPAGEDVLSMVIGGDIRDAFEVITGRDMVTGIRLSTAARVIAVAGFFVPVVSGALIRRVATRVGIEIAEEIGERVAREVAAEGVAERVIKEAALIPDSGTLKTDLQLFARIKRPVQLGEAGRYAGLVARSEIADDISLHHMPQAALGFTPHKEGGALAISYAEHVQTRTFGYKGVSARQADSGLSFREVLYKDITDMRRISGSMYNKGIRDLLDYYRTSFPDLMRKGGRR